MTHLRHHRTLSFESLSDRKAPAALVDTAFDTEFEITGEPMVSAHPRFGDTGFGGVQPQASAQAHTTAQTQTTQQDQEQESGGPLAAPSGDLDFESVGGPTIALAGGGGQSPAGPIITSFDVTYDGVNDTYTFFGTYEGNGQVTAVFGDDLDGTQQAAGEGGFSVTATANDLASNGGSGTVTVVLVNATNQSSGLHSVSY